MADRAQFESIINDLNQKFAEARERGATWFPPDNDYLCSIKGLIRDVRTFGDGKSCPVWQFTLAILDDGEYKGREMPLEYRGISKDNISIGMFKGLVRIMTGQDPPSDPATAADETDKLAETFVGEVVTVRVKLNAKKTYTNLDIREHHKVPETEPATESKPEG